MIFSSGIFIFFFAIVFLIQWYVIARIPGEERRKKALFLFLLFASYLFYMSWDWRFGFLILFSTMVDYCAGILITRFQDRAESLNEDEASALPFRRKAKLALLVSLLVNLGSLGIFKYFHFFAESFHALIVSVDPDFGSLEQHGLLFRIILPVGISFFTFQSMSYTIDVYRKIIPVERSFIRFALFVSFFPQLVAGPIVTAREFLPQLETFPRVDSSDLREGCRIFLLGFIKKSVLADTIAPYADMVHADPGAYGFFGTWMGVFAFSIQLYLDFSGYSDMAIGSARLLGFKLPENFRMPYLTRSCTEHWTCWHITLSRWFRDYLYIPLGGNRVGAARHKFNIFAVMAVSGLWHGAAWTYVAWGVSQGLAMVLENLLKPVMDRIRGRLNKLGSWAIKAWDLLAWTYQLIFIVISHNVLFRIEDISNSWPMFKTLLGLEGSMAMDIQEEAVGIEQELKHSTTPAVNPGMPRRE